MTAIPVEPPWADIAEESKDNFGQSIWLTPATIGVQYVITDRTVWRLAGKLDALAYRKYNPEVKKYTPI